MSNESIEKFKRHIKLGKYVELGEDTFFFRPLTYEDLPDFMEVMTKMFEHMDDDSLQKTMKPLKEGDEEAMDAREIRAIFKMLDKNTVKLVASLERKMVQLSYPHVDEEYVKDLVRDNLIDLWTPMMEINLPAFEKDLQKDNVDKTKSPKA